jgi:hypothetical protein
MTNQSNHTELPARPLGQILFSLIIAWLIPGLGHILHRDKRRGLVLFAVIHVTFLLGIVLHGAVLAPPYSPNDLGFNLVNFLTFLVQLGSGLAALLSLGVSQMAPSWAETVRAHTLYDLGSIYLLVAGASNSFTVGWLYDRHLRRGRPVSVEDRVL